MKLALGVLSLLVVEAGAAPDSDPLVDGKVQGPEPEIGKSTRQMPVIPVPTFDVPAQNPDGTLPPRAVRLRTKALLDHDIAIKGVITWAYDCVTANLQPTETIAEARKRIDADPTLCERPKFYVGDSASTAPDSSIWVVEVPRVYNKLELTRIKKQDRTDSNKCEPDGDPKKKLCPPFKVGDEVIVVGTWKQTSPHSERNSDGLLVYTKMKNVTQGWETPGKITVPVAPSYSPPARERVVLPKLPAARVPAKVKKSVREASLAVANEGTKAYGARQWETAIERYTKSTAIWADNALAWYGMAGAYAQRGDWAKAAGAAAHTVQIDPTNAMYRSIYGRALYEKAIHDAREDLARKQAVKPEEVTLDYAAINFEKALEQIRIAVAIDSRLWRAHYLMGTIFRHRGEPNGAGAAFAHAVVRDPSEAAPWIALVELLRAWDHRDDAIRVAEAAVGAPLDPGGASDVWFELGMAYDAKLLDDKAIAAFDKSLDQQRDNHKARFARGQIYFRKGDYAKAKRDLEEFVKSRSPGLEFFKQQASRMLMDIAAKSVRP